MRFLVSGRVRLTALVAVVVGLAAGGIAYASIPDANGVIHGCYQKVNGQLRVIDTDKGGKCLASEAALNWNQTGARGPTGPSGVSLFADVKSDGTLVHGTATAATRIASGVYTVTFGQDVSGCAAVANVGLFAGADSVFLAFAGSGTAPATPDNVDVVLSSGFDSSFRLIVAC
jgi:hypothetical protein